MLSVLRRNRDRLLERIEQASAQAGRLPESVRLLAVTKSVRSKVAIELARAGQVDLGENRIDAFEQKLLDFADADVSPVWHFIGHIQRNKAARVVRAADVIHSVDSIPLLRALARHATEARREIGIYLQVKLSQESTKHGLAETELREAVELTRAFESLELLGLMGMAPLVEDPERASVAARNAFDGLAALAQSLPNEDFKDGQVRLSMGMSGDFEQAIAAGAGIVRVGSALFEGIDRSERVGPKFTEGGEA